MLRGLAVMALTSSGVIAAAASMGSAVATDYLEMCDASAAVAVNDELFLVANDEDPDAVLLRLYKQRPGADVESRRPVATFPISGDFLQLKPKHREVDVEGAARIGDLVYWIGSHSTNKDGEPRPNRRRLFATRIGQAGGVTVKAEGEPYKSLIDDLDGDARFASFHLNDAAKKPPKDEGALSIEGLAATPDGGLLIGFRNPIPEGKALVARLENPGEVIRGKEARFGAPIRLDLGGLGVRSLESRPDGAEYLIVAGAFGEGGASRLYRWSGDPDAAPKVVANVGFPDLNPEALFFSADRVTVLSDDGTRKAPGHDQECKTLAPMLQMFRAVTIQP